jgi:hypothetical protein
VARNLQTSIPLKNKKTAETVEEYYEIKVIWTENFKKLTSYQNEQEKNTEVKSHKVRREELEHKGSNFPTDNRAISERHPIK